MLKSLIARSAFTLSLLTTASTNAQVSDFNVKTINAGNGLIINQISISFQGLYGGSQILLELDSGSIHNEPLVGLDTPPNAALLPAFPELAFDTYVAQGALFSSDPTATGTPQFAGGAVNIDPTEQAGVFNSATKISQTFFPAGGLFIQDRTDFVVAQIVLSDDAQGRFDYFAVTDNGNFQLNLDNRFSYIENGRLGIIIPEPASVLPILLSIACATGAGRRNSNRSD